MVNTIIEYIDPIQVKKVIDTEIYELSDDNKAYDYIRPVSISFTNVRDNYYKYYNTNYTVTWDYTLNAADPINVKDVNVAIYYYKSGSADNLSVVTAFAPLDSKSTQWALPNMVETGSYYFQMDIDYASEIFTIISDEFKVIEPVNPVLKFNTGSMMLTASYNSLYKVDFVVDKYNSDILDSVDVYYTTDGDYVRYTKLNNSPITLSPGTVTQSYSEWVIPTDMMPFRLKVSGKSKIDSTEIFVEYPKFGESKIPIVQESFDRFLRILDIGTYIDKYSVPPTYSSSVISPGLGGFVQFVFHRNHQLRDTIDIYVRLDESENIWTPVKLECDLYNKVINPNTNEFITGSVDIEFTNDILYPDSGEVRFKIETRTIDSNINEPPNVVLYYNAQYKVANEVIPPIEIQNVIQMPYTQHGVTITPAPNVIYYDLTSSLVNIPWETNENMSDIYTEYVDLYYSTDNPPTNYLLMDNSIRFYSGGTTSTTVASGSYNWKLPDTIGVIPTSSLKLVVKEKRTGKEIVATKKVHILKHDQGFHGISDLSVVNLSQTSLQRPKKFDNTVLYYGDAIQLKFKRQGQYLSGSKIEILVDDPSLDIVTHTHTKLIDSYGHPAYKISGLNPVWETPEYLLDGTYVGIPAGDLEYPLPIKIRVTDINRFTLETYEQIYYGQLNKRNLNVDIGDISEIWSDINDTLRISWYGDGLSKNFNIDLVSGSAFYPIAQNLEFQNSNYSYEFKVKGIPLPYDTNKFKVRVTSITPSWVQNNIQQVVGESAEFTMHIPNLQIGGLSNMVSANALSGNVSVNVVNDMGWKSILGFLLWSVDEFIKPKYIVKSTKNINVPRLKLDRNDAWSALVAIKNEYTEDGSLSPKTESEYQAVFNNIFTIMSSMYRDIIFNDDGKRLFYAWFYSACRIDEQILPNSNKINEDFYGINRIYLHEKNVLFEYFKLFKDLKKSSFYQVIEGNILSGSTMPTLSHRIDQYINKFETLSLDNYVSNYIDKSNPAYVQALDEAQEILYHIPHNKNDIFIIGNDLKEYLSSLMQTQDFTLDKKCVDTLYTAYELLNSKDIPELYKNSNFDNPTWIEYVGVISDTILNTLPTITSDYQMRLHYDGTSNISVKYNIQNSSYNYTNNNYLSMYYRYLIPTVVPQPYSKSKLYIDKFNDWKSELSPYLGDALSYSNLITSPSDSINEISYNKRLLSIQKDREFHFNAMLKMLYYFAISIQKSPSASNFDEFSNTIISILENNNFKISSDQFKAIVLVKNKYFNALIDYCQSRDIKFQYKNTVVRLLRYVDYFVVFEKNNIKYTLFEITAKLVNIYTGMNAVGDAFGNEASLKDRILDFMGNNENIKRIFGNLVANTMSNELNDNQILNTPGLDNRVQAAVQQFAYRTQTATQTEKYQKLMFYPEVCITLLSAMHYIFAYPDYAIYAKMDIFFGNNQYASDLVFFMRDVIVGEYGYHLAAPIYSTSYADTSYEWNYL